MSALEDELLTEPEAAEFLRMTPGGLANARRAGRAPPSIKIGRQVRYWARVLLNHLDQNTREPAAGKRK